MSLSIHVHVQPLGHDNVMDGNYYSLNPYTNYCFFLKARIAHCNLNYLQSDHGVVDHDADEVNTGSNGCLVADTHASSFSRLFKTKREALQQPLLQPLRGLSSPHIHCSLTR